MQAYDGRGQHSCIFHAIYGTEYTGIAQVHGVKSQTTVLSYHIYYYIFNIITARGLMCYYALYNSVQVSFPHSNTNYSMRFLFLNFKFNIFKFYNYNDTRVLMYYVHHVIQLKSTTIFYFIYMPYIYSMSLFTMFTPDTL